MVGSLSGRPGGCVAVLAGWGYNSGLGSVTVHPLRMAGDSV